MSHNESSQQDVSPIKQARQKVRKNIAFCHMAKIISGIPPPSSYMLTCQWAAQDL